MPLMAGLTVTSSGALMVLQPRGPRLRNSEAPQFSPQYYSKLELKRAHKKHNRCGRAHLTTMQELLA